MSIRLWNKWLNQMENKYWLIYRRIYQTQEAEGECCVCDGIRSVRIVRRYMCVRRTVCFVMQQKGKVHSDTPHICIGGGDGMTTRMGS